MVCLLRVQLAKPLTTGHADWAGTAVPLLDQGRGFQVDPPYPPLYSLSRRIPSSYVVVMRKGSLLVLAVTTHALFMRGGDA